MVAVTEQEALPSIEFSTAKGNREREQEAEDINQLHKDWKKEMHLPLPTARGEPTREVVEEQSHDEKLPSVVTDAGGDTLATDTKSKKGILGSQPRGNHNVFTCHPKDPNCEVCKKTQNNTSLV